MSDKWMGDGDWSGTIIAVVIILIAVFVFLISFANAYQFIPDNPNENISIRMCERLWDDLENQTICIDFLIGSSNQSSSNSNTTIIQIINNTYNQTFDESALETRIQDGLRSYVDGRVNELDLARKDELALVKQNHSFQLAKLQLEKNSDLSLDAVNGLVSQELDKRDFMSREEVESLISNSANRITGGAVNVINKPVPSSLENIVSDYGIFILLAIIVGSFFLYKRFQGEPVTRDFNPRPRGPVNVPGSEDSYGIHKSNKKIKKQSEPKIDEQPTQGL